MNDSPLKLTDLVCFSPVRWNFAFQRPQHLLTRFADRFRVFFIEEPVFNADSDRYDISITPEKVVIVVPHLQHKSNHYDALTRQQEVLSNLFEEEDITDYIFWYYTAQSLPVSRHFSPRLVVYDCMTELSSAKNVSHSIKALEAELISKADLVFTSGYSLFEAKRKLHTHTYLIPSGVDYDHFAHARTITFDPPDQDSIPHPRIGFYGVIDERLDIDLLEKVSRLRPHWHFTMVGPVSKIDPAMLPNFHNIHYLGSKTYNELPHYLAGWDIAMIPYIHNDTTRYSSPTKTPEYLAGGKPVISTPIIDVIRGYGNKGLVRIAGTPDEFVRVAEQQLSTQDRSEWLEKVDDFLALNSWNKACLQIMNLIANQTVKKSVVKVQNMRGEEYV